MPTVDWACQEQMKLAELWVVHPWLGLFVAEEEQAEKILWTGSCSLNYGCKRTRDYLSQNPSIPRPFS